MVKIPDEAVEAAAKAMYMAEPWSTFWSIEDARSLCTAAIRAALENWPGMMHRPDHLHWPEWPHIILPLTENADG